VLKPSTPQTEAQMVTALKDSIATTPTKTEPVDDNPIPAASPPLPNNLARERPLDTTPPGEDLAVFAALNMAKTIADLDLVAPRAAKIQGPQRDELRKLYKLRKEEIQRGLK
jgi:hypothetical protein